MKAEIDYETLKQASAFLRGYIEHQKDVCDQSKSLFHQPRWIKAIQNWKSAARRWNWIISLMKRAAEGSNNDPR